ncbi:MAG: 5'-nucleotidase C-terminal domain-containing protein [Gammaproteobacteria bacterium]|nr:5'-nucleotidase C-terminal domain-containing protein [Gammaproteobacteria bacterium]
MKHRKLCATTLTFLFIAACAPYATQTEDLQTEGLTFIHLNDTYRIGAVESGQAGGFGRVVSVVRDAKQQGRDVRILHGGDFLYPSLESQLWDGQQMVDAFNYMDNVAPMYVVAGNHEFDRRTPEHLIDAVRQSQFDWLGDNYDFDTDDEQVDTALRRAFVFEHGDKKIGIFALTLHADDGGNDRAYVPTDINYKNIAEQTIQSLEKQNVDLIIGLTHLHMWQDVDIATLKARHPRLLFIVGGHEHEPEHSPATENRAAVMKGASNARVIWRIDVNFPDDGLPVIVQSSMLEMDERIESDGGYDEVEDKWRRQLLEKFPFLTATVGEASVPLDAREVTIRNRESSWGNFVVDQMRGAFGEPPVDFAFINSGTLRIDDFISGDIRFEDIGRTFGFSSFLRYLSLSGREFRQVLEAGYRGAGPSKGYFPQVSGFRICVNRANTSGERIVSMQRPTEDGWAEIDDAAEYTVVVPDYVYRGGDGYEFPEHRQASRPGSELKYLVLDAIMVAQAQGQKVGAPVDPANPRIVVLNGPDDDCFR